MRCLFMRPPASVGDIMPRNRAAGRPTEACAFRRVDIVRPSVRVCAMDFSVAGTPRNIGISSLVIAGWTGRDRAAVEEHIAELGAIGVKPPRTIPCFYRLGANLLTTAAELEVVGEDSSGEVEFVLISAPDGIHVGVGSDHTDRKVESYGITVSKQMCPKPVGRTLWRLDEVEDHWDRMQLRSHVTRKGKRVLYQEGAVSGMLAPRDV